MKWLEIANQFHFADGNGAVRHCSKGSKLSLLPSGCSQAGDDLLQ